MKTALLFREGGKELIEVSADEVKNGLYDRHEEFVDPEYEFKVQFVKGAKGNGGPYFRLYYSYEEYKKLFPERASRYEIVANMRRYEESQWHVAWKNKFSSFCDIEKCIKNNVTKQRKFADAYYDKTRTCIEFQHSYISFDFEERNFYYSNMSINTIWLYDLSTANVRQDEQGNIEILEDNAKGFFRISEKQENLKNNFVYIHVKSGLIYRVRNLLRRETSTDKKSTIRYFMPTEVYTENEFINAIKFDQIKKDEFAKPLKELWDSSYSWIIVKNIENGDVIYINCNGNGEMFRDFKSDCIKYKYVNGDKHYKKHPEYRLSHKMEKMPIWVLLKAE